MNNNNQSSVMQTNVYYEKLNRFRELLKSRVSDLFDWYGNKLMLRLEDYNLLARSGNCIESSTAIGFVLEEFIVSKLEEYTKAGKEKGFTLHSFRDSTTKRSCDCYALYEGVKFLINIKTEKRGSTNNAVAAVNQLVKDYCSFTEEIQECSYLILKISYEFLDEDLYRRICIVGSPIIRFLEEYDFSHGHSQDHRSWSDKDTKKKSMGNNSRLLLSKKFTQDHTMPIEDRSFNLTRKQLRFLNTVEGLSTKYIMPVEAFPPSLQITQGPS